MIKKENTPAQKSPVAQNSEHTRSIGRRGEEIAVSYLERSGYGIIATNWQIW